MWCQVYMDCLNIRMSLYKLKILKPDRTQLHKRALILTTLDRIIAEHPVDYQKAVKSRKYQKELYDLLNSKSNGRITIIYI